MKKTKRRAKLLLVLLVLCISIGYAVLQSNLNIQGTASINNPIWDFCWDNVQITDGSVTGSNVIMPATIDTPRTTVNYNIKLPKPGDYYEFTVDAINNGTIDAMIDSISSKLNGTEISTLPNYLNYSVTYLDGIPLEANHIFKADTRETYRVRIEFTRHIDVSQLPTTVQNLNLSFAVNYKQADENAVIRSFYIYTANKTKWNDTTDVRIGYPIPSGAEQFSTAAEALEASRETLGWLVSPSENIFFYLKHKVENEIVTESYLEFVISQEMADTYPGFVPGTYDIRGGDDGAAYSTSKSTLLKSIGNNYCQEESAGNNTSIVCWINESGSEGVVFGVETGTSGDVRAWYDYPNCIIREKKSYCTY